MIESSLKDNHIQCTPYKFVIKGLSEMQSQVSLTCSVRKASVYTGVPVQASKDCSTNYTYKVYLIELKGVIGSTFPPSFSFEHPYQFSRRIKKRKEKEKEKELPENIMSLKGHPYCRDFSHNPFFFVVDSSFFWDAVDPYCFQNQTFAALFLRLEQKLTSNFFQILLFEKHFLLYLRRK